MNCSPTLTAEEFKQIHNGLCDLRSVIGSLEGVLATKLYDKLVNAQEQISVGLIGVYEQDEKAYTRKSNHYKSVQKDLGLDAIWSMFEVHDLNERHRFEGATKVVYRNHWGEKPVSCAVIGNTWASLYVAADVCIRDSGDDHHVFIENFEQEDEVLILITGS